MTGEMDQQRFKALLKETITLLCNNGLNFKSEFTIEAVIGITIDRESILLVSIQDTITNCVKSKSAQWLPQADSGENEFTVSPNGRLKSPRDADSPSCGEPDKHCGGVIEVMPVMRENVGLYPTDFGKCTDGLNIKLEQTVNNFQLKSEYVSSPCENIQAKPSFPTDEQSLSCTEVQNLDPLLGAHFSNGETYLHSQTQPVEKLAEELPGLANVSRNDLETSAFTTSSLGMTRLLEPYTTEETLDCKTNSRYTDQEITTVSSVDNISKSKIDLPRIHLAKKSNVLLQKSQDLQLEMGCNRKTSNLSPYQCKTCGKRIGSRHSLDVHEATVHLGKYRYSCPNCGKGYSVLSNLRAHISCKHNKRKEFVCGFCGREYGYKHSLKEHILLVHNENLSFN